MKTQINSKLSTSFLIRITPLFILIGQNIITFHNHYFNDYGFPWDFSQAYYGYTVFWTTLVSQGVYPSWVPFASMGIPFDLNLQSGAHYPPLWIYPLFKVEYSLHAAVVFQCLHILFGAIGMYYFLKLVFETKKNKPLYALVGAFVFQFFGGFYSNAEHLDIIRAFSFAPWLFYLYTFPKENTIQKIPVRYFFIPLGILFAVTGAYPGNLISSGLVIALYVLFQIINQWFSKKNWLHTLKIPLFMSIIGLGLTIFHLAPAWLYKDYLTRTNQTNDITFYNIGSLGIEHLPALFLDNALVPGEISMTSTYLTIPALLLLGFISLKTLKENWSMGFILIFSVLMVAGNQSFFWIYITRITKVTGLSRFPSSDYRIFIAIVLIYFSILALKNLLENPPTWKSFIFRTGMMSLLFCQAIFVSYPILRSQPVYYATTIFLAGILSIIFLITFKNYLHTNLAVFILPFLILISVDAMRVIPEMRSWRLPSATQYYPHFNWQLEKNGQLLTYEIIQNTPAYRPNRIIKKSFLDYSWSSYIIGDYTLDIFERPSHLKSNDLIVRQPIYKEFMLQAWSPLLVESDQIKIISNNVNIPIELFSSNSPKIKPKQIQQTHYGINEIYYQVSLDKPTLMVENEIYFPGWSATLDLETPHSTIQAVSVNNIFRAWLLPVGTYQMKAQFEFPYSKIYNSTSILFFILWFVLIFYFTKQNTLPLNQK